MRACVLDVLLRTKSDDMLREYPLFLTIRQTSTLRPRTYVNTGTGALP